MAENDMLTQWWKLSQDIAQGSMEAQHVIALRLAKIAAGGAAAEKEAHTMVTEKMAAHAEAALTLASGGSMSTVVQRYRAIVRANNKRLTGKRG
jgi:hypothetical protein